MLVTPLVNLSWVVIVLSLPMSAVILGFILIQENDDAEDVKAQNTIQS